MEERKVKSKRIVLISGTYTPGKLQSVTFTIREDKHAEKAGIPSLEGKKIKLTR